MNSSTHWDVEAVREQMIQIDDKFKMLMEVHKEYNSLLPLEMQEQDKDRVISKDFLVIPFFEMVIFPHQ